MGGRRIWGGLAPPNPPSSSPPPVSTSHRPSSDLPRGRRQTFFGAKIPYTHRVTGCGPSHTSLCMAENFFIRFWIFAPFYPLSASPFSFCCKLFKDTLEFNAIYSNAKGSLCKSPFCTIAAIYFLHKIMFNIAFVGYVTLQCVPN